MTSEARNAESDCHRVLPECQDAGGEPGWTCVDNDGTGLWCDACLAWAEARSKEHL